MPSPVRLPPDISRLDPDPQNFMTGDTEPLRAVGHLSYPSFQRVLDHAVARGAAYVARIAVAQSFLDHSHQLHMRDQTPKTSSGGISDSASIAFFYRGRFCYAGQDLLGKPGP